MKRLLSVNRVLPNKSHPFSIVWVDDTDSICDLPCLLTSIVFGQLCEQTPQTDASQVMHKGETIEQFATSMHLVLDLVDKYPRDTLAAHILDVVAQFLPVLLTTCCRRDRVRQIVSNTKRFHRGEWKALWEPCVLHGEKLTPMLRVCVSSVIHQYRLE